MVPCKLTTRMSRLRCVGYPHLLCANPITRQPPRWIEYNAIRWDMVGSGGSHRCSAFYPVKTQVRTPAFLLGVITKIVVGNVLILSAAYVLGVYGEVSMRVAEIRAASPRCGQFMAEGTVTTKPAVTYHGFCGAATRSLRSESCINIHESATLGKSKTKNHGGGAVPV